MCVVDMTSFAKFEVEVSAGQLMYVLLESISICNSIGCHSIWN